MKKEMEDEEYVKWIFMLGEYERGQRLIHIRKYVLENKGKRIIVRI